MGNGVSFESVPVNSNVEFHFILAFAIDYTSNGSSSTNGEFAVFWQPNLTPEAVAAIKAKHENVRVMVSLGGDTANGKPCQFNPVSISSWVSNAVTSLTALVEEYHLDGIDIDYEHFDYSEPHVFASCIGQLITTLKQNQVISIASIAPYDDVHRFYSALWRSNHSQLIDYVNFQFYTYDASTSVSQYLKYYKRATRKYSGGKVLASFSTDPPTGVSASTVLTACRQLREEGELPGIFVWSADSTIDSSFDDKFNYEKQAQSLLA